MTSNQKAVRTIFLSALGLSLSALSGTALAQQPAPGASSNCPPGSWFCNDAAKANGNAGAAPSNGQLQPLPGTAPAPAAASVEVGAPAPAAAPAAPAAPAPAGTPVAPPVVVYQPAPPPVVVVQGRVDAPPPYQYTPRPNNRLPYNRQEWGLNLRLEGAILGRDKADNSGMGGGGLALRFKPSPYFGIEAGVDFLGGKDYYGDRRGEVNFSVSGLVFVNPRSRVQVYFPLGVDWATASINRDGSRSPGWSDSRYYYFGGHAGVGLEFRVARHFALNLAMIGFIRGRTDAGKERNPEFVEAGTGRTSNTSGGGLFQGGMTIYF
ncbi:porin family protein [Pendulispora brunnea]|uniref:Porin family protein n=1 Tax=Pendulispora brunnea TaxID=2905690 RepID=A0ABZ2K790_9BACT